MNVLTLALVLLLTGSALGNSQTFVINPASQHGTIILRNQSFGSLSPSESEAWQTICKKIAESLTTNGPFAKTTCLSGKPDRYQDGWVVDFRKKGRMLGLDVYMVYQGKPLLLRELTFTSNTALLKTLDSERTRSLLSRLIRNVMPIGWRIDLTKDGQSFAIPQDFMLPEEVGVFGLSYDPATKHFNPDLKGIFVKSPGTYKLSEVIHSSLKEGGTLWMQDINGVDQVSDQIEVELKKDSPKLRLKSYMDVNLLANSESSLLSYRLGTPKRVENDLVPMGGLKSLRFDLRSPWFLGLSAGKEDIAEGIRVNDQVSESFKFGRTWAGLSLGASMTLPKVVIRLDISAKKMTSNLHSTVGITSLQFGRIPISLDIKDQSDQAAEVSLETQWSYVRTKVYGETIKKRVTRAQDNQYFLNSRTAGADFMVRITPHHWYLNAYLLGFAWGTQLTLEAFDKDKALSENTDSVTNLEITSVFTGGGLGVTW